MTEIEEIQRSVCRSQHAEFLPAISGSKLGIAHGVRNGLLPINGLRHPPAEDTNGWYIWAGEELSSSDDFFEPLHVEHVGQWCPLVEKYLALPPGFRFLVTPTYSDVWFDPDLLNPR